MSKRLIDSIFFLRIEQIHMIDSELRPFLMISSSMEILPFHHQQNTSALGVVKLIQMLEQDRQCREARAMTEKRYC